MWYLLFALLAIVVAAAAWWIRRSLLAALRQPHQDPALILLQNQVHASSQQAAQQIEALRGALGQVQGQIAQSLDTTRQAMDTRLDTAARVIQGVSQQLGKLDESSRHIFDVGRNIAELQEILRSPKLRGNLGETLLAELLAQILPADHFRLQHGFRGGEVVDAVIRLKAGMIPVDAKFPLENFRLLLQAGTDEERKAARKAFERDVKAHIQAIAKKYIRTDEGTFDFALMYIPAENVYYETIIKDEPGVEPALFQLALSRRVIPVSPNSFYAYLQTILLGLKGLQIEESARDILNRLAELRKEFERFEEPFRLIGRHLENAGKNYADAERRAGKIESQLEHFGSAAQKLSAPAADSNALPPPSE